jgi:hypothetical protein
VFLQTALAAETGLAEGLTLEVMMYITIRVVSDRHSGYAQANSSRAGEQLIMIINNCFSRTPNSVCEHNN